MAEIKTVVKKLRVSWIVIVVAVSLIGCCVSMVLTLHDYFVKKNSYSKIKESLNEELNTRKNIEDFLSSNYRSRDIQDEFRVACQNASGALSDLSTKEKIDSKLKEFCISKNVQFGKDDKFIADGCEYGLGFISANSNLGKLSDSARKPMIESCAQKTENEFLTAETKKLEEYKEKLSSAGFVFYGFDSRYSVHLNNLWGGNEYTSLSSLLYALNWLLGGGIVLLISSIIQHWVSWLVRDEK